ncbi:MAG: hypothetical protein ABIP75_00920 [Pyrinomonadaceae bacterium]
MLPVTTPPPLRTVALTTLVRRWLVLLPTLFALVGCGFAVRWSAGSTLAQSTDPDLSALAVRLSPGDPQTHYSFGKSIDASLSAELQKTAALEYEQAARTSPEDYRIWMVLATARERLGDATGAETAFRRAEQLAPDYSMPHWAAGNFFLRQGNEAEALPRLWDAAITMDRLRRPVLELFTSYYDGDIEKLAAEVGRHHAIRLSYFQFLLDRGYVADAYRLWSSLEPDEQLKAATLGQALVTALSSAHRYFAALNVANDLNIGPKVEFSQVDNPGFEASVETGGSNLFSWRIAPGVQPQIALDGSQLRTGNNSLTLVFDANGTVPLREITQLIVVPSSKTFRLSYSVRSQDIKGQSTIRIEIVRAEDNSVLARSAPIPAGSSDWRNETLEFTTPPQTDGVILRIAPVPCTTEVCPLFGRVWFDDFELQRTETPSAPSP